ncbi:MAG: hypothetical protein H6Q68_2171 [Firmicutes bacterium]|nr:hypothetical protein [Bacillota bacterium]
MRSLAAYEVVAYSTGQVFVDKEQEWRDFETGQQTLYLTQSYDWLRLWWEIFEQRADQQFGLYKELLIIMLYKEGTLVAIAPLVKLIRKKYGLQFSFIEFLSQQWGSAFMDIIGDGQEPDSKAYIIAWLYKNIKFDVMNLSYIPESSTTLNIAERKHVFKLSACPIIPVTNYSSFQEYIDENCSSHHKRNLRTSTNRIRRDGLKYECTWEKVSTENIKDIYRVSKSKLLDGKTSIYLDEGKRRFMLGVLSRFTADALFIKLNGRIAAYRLQLYFRDWKFCIDAAYDRDFRPYGVGLLSLRESIQDSFAKQLAVHCEGPGPDDYKLAFIRRVITIYDCMRAGNTFFSPAVFSRLMSKRILR